MSELAKRIGRVQRREITGGMGFHPAKRQEPHSMLLAARVRDLPEARAALDAGADVVLLQGMDAAGAKAAAESIGGGSTGVSVESLDEATAAEYQESGSDFVVSPLDRTASAAVNTEKIGHVVVVTPDIPDSALRSLGPLGLDALFVEGSASAPTLADQLELVRLSSFSGLPLAVNVEAGASVAHLRVLRDSGAVLAVTLAGTTAEEIKSLVATIAAIPAPRKSTRGADMALLPSASAQAHDDDEIEEPE